jgi:hypothetical protein
VADTDITKVYICPTADTPSPYTDNLVGKCEECGCDIQMRPHAPSYMKKVCSWCGVLGLIDAHGRGDEIKILPGKAASQ